MNLIKAILKGILGLFVDDGSFAVLIVAWIAATWLLSFKVLQTPEWGTLLLFAGLVVILIGSTACRCGDSTTPPYLS
ncbi:hypothetical protein [Tardiphaga sp.]|uniref:hypothetical protein n=1 Tax=Tardiphaga sp. TaxID=1926292 RepID=UPI00352AF6FC